MNRYISTIYTLIDPRTEQVRYVGQTRTKLSARLKLHLISARNGRETPKDQWIRELMVSDIEPIICPLENVDHSDGDEAESWWIQRLAASGIDLLNIIHLAQPQRLQNREEREHVAALYMTRDQIGDIPKTRIAAALGISRWTLDRYLADLPEVKAHLRRIREAIEAERSNYQ